MRKIRLTVYIKDLRGRVDVRGLVVMISTNLYPVMGSVYVYIFFNYYFFISLIFILLLLLYFLV